MVNIPYTGRALLCAASLLLWGGCEPEPEDECDPQTFKQSCSDSKTQEGCVVTYEGGRHHVLSYIRCPDPYVCIDTGAPLVGVICAHSTKPDPACTASYVCQGTTLLSCQAGYRAGHELCKTCKVGTFLTCDGSVWTPCTGDGDCVAGLKCKDTPGVLSKQCLRACSCPDGTRPCADCVEFSTTRVQCDSGRCV
jgi:hypothetical protein